MPPHLAGALVRQTVTQRTLSARKFNPADSLPTVKESLVSFDVLLGWYGVQGNEIG